MLPYAMNVIQWASCLAKFLYGWGYIRVLPPLEYRPQNPGFSAMRRAGHDGERKRANEETLSVPQEENTKRRRVEELVVQYRLKDGERVQTYI